MENERSGYTEAQAQIEKLKKMKEQKDQADKIKKEDEFRFAELPHAVSSSPQQPAEQPAGEIQAGVNPSKSALHPAAGVKTDKNKKAQRVSRLDKKNFDRIRKTVKRIKEAGTSMRLSDDMFVNMVLEKVLEMKIDFSQAKTSEEVRAIIGKIKAE